MPQFNQEALALFNEFIVEREQVRLRRKAGMAAPWTTNKIIRNYRFCNVRREDDTNSLWLINNIAKNDSLELRDKIVNMICARMYNNLNTMNLVFPHDYMSSIPSDLDSIDKLLSGTTYLCNAYMPVNAQYAAGYFAEKTGIDNGKTPSGKSAYYRPSNLLRLGYDFIENGTISHIIELARKSNQYDGTPYTIYEYLRQLPTMGEFMAYQHFVDLTYIPELGLNEDDFTIAGPGCMMGLQCLFAEELVDEYRHDNNTPNHNFKSNWGGYSPDMLIGWLQDNWNRYIDWPFDWQPTVMCIENMLCEGHKYIKTHKQWGTPRNKYDGGAQTPNLFNLQ